MPNKLVCSKNPLDAKTLFTPAALKQVVALKGRIWNTVMSGDEQVSGRFVTSNLRTALSTALDIRTQQEIGKEYDHFYVVSDAAITELLLAKLADNPALTNTLQIWKKPDRKSKPAVVNRSIRVKTFHLREGWQERWLLAEVLARCCVFDQNTTPAVGKHAIGDIVELLGEHVGLRLIKQANAVLAQVAKSWERVCNTSRTDEVGTVAAELIIKTGMIDNTSKIMAFA